MNPDQYRDQQNVQKEQNINQNLFDDGPEESDHNSSNASFDSNEPIFDENNQFPRNNEGDDSSMLSAAVIDSSYDVSGLAAPVPERISKAASREKAIDDEIERYAQFSKQEFSDLCTERGLTRKNPNKFEPVGHIAWEFWRTNKHKYPIIYKVIKTILQAPTSSSAIERLFSRVSAYVTPLKNRFKSKNLMALLQISEMDDFLRVSADCFKQNGINYDVEAEISYLNSIKNQISQSNAMDDEFIDSDPTEFDFSDLLNYEF